MARKKKIGTRSTPRSAPPVEPVACPPDSLRQLSALQQNMKSAQEVFLVAMQAVRSALQVPTDWVFDGKHFAPPEKKGTER